MTLRNASDPKWDNDSTHEVDFPIPATVNPPLTETKGIVGVRINLVQNNPDWSADNWDLANLAVSLLNPGSPSVCQLNLADVAGPLAALEGLSAWTHPARGDRSGAAAPPPRTRFGSPPGPAACPGGTAFASA